MQLCLLKLSRFFTSATSCRKINLLKDVFTPTTVSFQVTIQGEWALWSAKVPQVEVETHKVGAPDVVIPTIDTVRHEALLYTWLAEHKPMVLCGPPGSGELDSRHSSVSNWSCMSA